MKILHIGKFYYPYKGGIETVTKDLAEGCIDENCLVKILCFNHKNLDTHSKINQVEVIRSATWFTLFSQPIGFSIITKFIKLNKWADLIHIHTPNPLLEMILLFFATKPIVITHHSDVIKQKSIYYFYSFFQRKLYHKAHKIIVPTQNHINFSNILGEKFLNKIEVIPFGIEDRAENHKQDRSGSTRYVVFIGRLVEYKGVSVLINALANTHYHLKIIGEGPLRSELESLTSKLSLNSKVSFLGQIGQNKLTSTLLGSEALILPSISENENFGMVQLEAMMYGIPIIVSRLKSGVTSVAIDNESCLHFRPGSTDDLTQKMNRLWNEEFLRKKLSFFGRRRYEDHYKLEKMINQHKRLYQQILGIQDSSNKEAA